MDSYEHNRQAWNAFAASGGMWSTPVSPEEIARARGGDWSVLLTPTKPVPAAWFGAAVAGQPGSAGPSGSLRGKDVLGLASGGGQQCPIFAAAGARVTSFDASDVQLSLDRAVAEREGLALRTVQGNMKDLSAFADASFDLVFNPCSVSFVDAVEPVWREVARVLRPGGVLLSGLTNPWFYLFDVPRFDAGELAIVHRLPVSIEADGMVEFSHTIDTLIGGQLRAGLALVDLFEDEWDAWAALKGIAPAFIATRAIKR